MTINALKSRRIIGVLQDRSQEFLSLLVCICANSTKLPPSLIYKRESHNLQDSWLDDLGSDTAYFAASTNGQTCDSLSVGWLTNIFDRHTKEKARYVQQLLIVDSHSSHVNIKFLKVAYSLRILVYIMLLHSMHRLQPLDVGMFSLLLTAYS